MLWILVEFSSGFLWNSIVSIDFNKFLLNSLHLYGPASRKWPLFIGHFWKYLISWSLPHVWKKFRELPQKIVHFSALWVLEPWEHPRFLQPGTHSLCQASFSLIQARLLSKRRHVKRAGEGPASFRGSEHAKDCLDRHLKMIWTNKIIPA